MRIKMLEYYQGVGVSGVMENGNTVNVLEPGETYEVSEKMAKWCVDNGKAAAVEKPAVVDGGLGSAKELSEHYKEVAEVLEVLPNEAAADETPIMTTANQVTATPAVEKVVIDNPKATTTHTRHGGRR